MANDLEKLALIMQQIRAELGPPPADAAGPRIGVSGVVPAYEWGQVLTFGASGNGLPHLGGGWSYPEEAYIWSDGPVAGFAAQVAPVRSLLLLSFHCSAFVHDQLPAQRIRVVAGGNIQGEWTVAQSCDCHALLSVPEGTESLALDFRFIDARSPRDLGLSADPRVLGIALDRLSLQPLPSSST